MAKIFPRPMGGPEPIAQGVTDKIPTSDAPTNPGYDYRSSIDGASVADQKRGYRGRSRITDAGSDGMGGA